LSPPQSKIVSIIIVFLGEGEVGGKSKISVSGKGSLKPGRKLFTGSIQVHEIYNNAAKKAAEQF